MIRFQTVYNSLKDKESKDIFIKKMMFYITSDYSHDVKALIPDYKLYIRHYSILYTRRRPYCMQYK